MAMQQVVHFNESVLIPRGEIETVLAETDYNKRFGVYAKVCV